MSLEGGTCDSVAPRPVSSLGRKQPILSQCETGLLPAFCSVSLFNQFGQNSGRNKIRSAPSAKDISRTRTASVLHIQASLSHKILGVSMSFLHNFHKTARPKTSHAKYCISSFPLFTLKKRQGFLLRYSETCRPRKVRASQNFSLTSKCKTVQPLV